MSNVGEFYGLESRQMTEIVKRFPRPNLIGKALFPSAPSTTKSVYWDIVSGARTMAKYSVSGAEAHISALQPRTRVNTEVLYVREKKVIDEQTKNFIDKVGQFDVPYGEQLLTDELEALDRMTENTKEKARWEALTTGKLHVQQVDPPIQLKVDYGFTATHIPTADVLWSTTATANPLSDILTYKKLISRDSWVTPTDAYCNSTIMQYLVENSKIQTLLQYTVGNDLAKNGYISVLAGINLNVYDVSYVNDAGTVAQFIPDTKFVMIAKPGMGKEFTGPIDTPTDTGAVTKIGKVSYSWSTKDPVDTWILVGDSFIPAIQNPDQIVAAIVA